MGWGVDGITPVPLGGFQHSLAALQTKQVDAMVSATETTLLLERQKKIKQMYNFAELVPKFITHVIFARKDVVKDKPDVVRRFVAAWFETVDYMRANKKESVEIAAKVLQTPADIVDRIHDMEIGEYSKTGTFDPESVAILKQSFIEMTLLDRKPADDELFTEAFLPRREALTR
jgi:NitT/TauT family transport system substrate-binding protein